MRIFLVLQVCFADIKNGSHKDSRFSLLKKSILPAYAGFEITFLPRAKGDCVDLAEAKNTSIRTSVYATLRLRNRARRADVSAENPRMGVFRRFETGVTKTPVLHYSLRFLYIESILKNSQRVLYADFAVAVEVRDCGVSRVLNRHSVAQSG